MSQLLHQLAIDAAATFLPDFGEWIRFDPWQNAPVDILAVIERDPASAISGLTGAGAYKHEIWIANIGTPDDVLAELGIVIPTGGRTLINKRKDAVWFANQVGGTKEKFVVTQILQNDQGMWHLGVG